MDGNKRRLRNMLLYAGIPVVVLFIIFFLFRNSGSQQETYKYSDILDLFERGQVAKYQLNLGTGEMLLTLEGNNPTKVGFALPSVDLFYRDASDDIAAYNA
ncbi:MAG: ATP-dependent zinc metalloprotease FtsH, partial [Firmicutes bacterium]|nr:ATP-dependent zinc metalloprotease FtsH [Bacillota bacterium]